MLQVSFCFVMLVRYWSVFQSVYSVLAFLCALLNLHIISIGVTSAFNANLCQKHPSNMKSKLLSRFERLWLLEWVHIGYKYTLRTMSLKVLSIANNAGLTTVFKSFRPQSSWVLFNSTFCRARLPNHAHKDLLRGF